MNSIFSYSRNRKVISLGIAAALLGLATMTIAAFQFPKVWVDASSGYAIGGYDPVDYFVKKMPVRPSAGIETYWGGASWKFRNVGNRSAFLAHPRIYVPRFGGVDPVLLTRRRTVFGNPGLFDVYEDRLYLFHNEQTLSMWIKNRARIVVKAKQAWPEAGKKIGLDVAEIINPDPLLE